jgi:hypothetical protein
MRVCSMSRNDWRCSVSRPMGRERLMCRGRSAPSSLLRRLHTLAAAPADPDIGAGLSGVSSFESSVASTLDCETVGCPPDYSQSYCCLHPAIRTIQCGDAESKEKKLLAAYATETMSLTLQVNVRRPVSLHMGRHPFPASMQSRIVHRADSRGRGVEIMERWWERRHIQRRGLLLLCAGMLSSLDSGRGLRR